MRLRFACAACDAANMANLPGPAAWTCTGCGKVSPFAATHVPLDHCAVCGNSELYRKKDFPQWLGMGLLAVACGLFFIFAIRYEYAYAWGILLGSAAIDAIIYLIVGDVVVCYRCGAQHRGLSSRGFNPHELAIAEKYRQERLRREMLKPASR